MVIMGFPTEQQTKVINHTGKPLVVIAAPGTGKARTIVTRMIKLLKEDPNREVSFITFTRTSRRDTESKVRKDVGKEAFEEATFIFPRVSTLHAYAKSIVHKYAQLINRENNFSIMIWEKGEHLLLASELIGDLNLVIEPSRLLEDITHYRCMNRFPSDSPIPTDKREEVLEYYEKLLRFYNTFDMEGIVQSACKILSGGKADFPQVFLQVDEYQDLNPMDQTLVEFASSTCGSQVVVVGDDAQSIYQLRHANPSGIRALWKSEKWDKVRFVECHRLPVHILRAAQALISGEDYLGAEVNIPPDNGVKICTLQCTKSDIQIDAVATLIKEIIKKKKNSKGAPLSYKNVMILCPNSAFVSKVSSILESKYQIPTKQREKPVIPDDHWRLLLVLRLLHSNDSLALRQWLSIIGIKPKEAMQLRHNAMKLNKSLYDYCSELDSSEIKKIFEHLKNIRENIDDIEEFKRGLLGFPWLLINESLFPEVNITINEATQQPYSLGSIIKFIHEKFGLIDSGKEIAEDIPEDDRVFVTTMYSAKGLEAEFIFIMWLNESLMPVYNRDIQEQLRVLYVGITRAKQDVIFTFHEKYDGAKLVKTQAMSPFLRKIISFLDIKRVYKSNYSSLFVAE